MLIIPTIALQNGTCVFQLSSEKIEAQTVFVDPLKMAKLWRVQNARTLFVYDLDAANSDSNNYNTLARMCESLDIPIMVAGGIRTPDAVETLLRIGAQKVLVESTRLENIHEIITHFPKTRLGFHLNVKADLSVSEAIEENALAFVQYLEEQRCRRVFCTARQTDNRAYFAPNVYLQLVQAAQKLHITISGGIRNYSDLKTASELHRRIDSVVLYRALYQNAFPCQNFWAWHQKSELDLEQFSTAPLRNLVD